MNVLNSFRVALAPLLGRDLPGGRSALRSAITDSYSFPCKVQDNGNFVLGLPAAPGGGADPAEGAPAVARPYGLRVLTLRPVFGHPETRNQALLRQWALAFAYWIQAGLAPYFFAHTLDNLCAPHPARAFHRFVAAHADVGALPH